VPGKRQHYIPRFMFRRFSINPADKKSHIFRLDKSSGKNGRVNPVNEAVVGHYYRLVDEDGAVDNTADELLDHFETKAADLIKHLGDPTHRPTPEDVFWLTLFIVTLKQRTPRGREALRATDERAGELQLEVLPSDRERYHRTMSGTGRAADEVEAERLKLLTDLRDGRLEMESSPSREVALMFMAFEQTGQAIFDELAWVCVRAPADPKSRFVLSDHPVAHYDPTPKVPEAGRSFMSSPNSSTFIPLDPKFGLLLVQGQPPLSWADTELTADEVDELNLLTYAWAQDAIYGPTQDSVTRVRGYAKSHRQQLAEFAYRPPRIWVTEDEGEPRGAGPRTFTSDFKGDRVSRALYVTQRGVDEARSRAWPPSDDESDAA
jgi:hypothetical protein